MKRNAKLDGLRFLYACIIVFRHTSVFQKGFILFRGGALSVEFFFILSGYLMALSVQKKNQLGSPKDLGTETWTFLWGKIRSFLPELLASLLLGFFWMEVQWRDTSIPLLGKRLMRIVWEPLLLSMAGFGTTRINGIDWYLSAMILAMLILYPICRKYFSMSSHVIMPAIAIFIFGFFCREDGTTVTVYAEMGPFYKGTLRAFAGLALGVTSYPIITALKQREFTRNQQILLSLAETVVYLVIFGYMFRYSKKQYDMVCVLLIFAGFCITSMEKGYWDHLFSHKVCAFLGKSSLILYLSHVYVARVLYYLFPDRSYYQLLFPYLFLTMINSFFVSILAGCLRRKLFSGKQIATEKS